MLLQLGLVAQPILSCLALIVKCSWLHVTLGKLYLFIVRFSTQAEHLPQAELISFKFHPWGKNRLQVGGVLFIYFLVLMIPVCSSSIPFKILGRMFFFFMRQALYGAVKQTKKSMLRQFLKRLRADEQGQPSRSQGKKLRQNMKWTVWVLLRS